MATVEEGLAALVKNIEAQYGKSMAEWKSLILGRGLTKHTEIMNMLKSEFGMTHGNANRVALISREADSSTINKLAEARGADPIDELYSGTKAVLKPIHDKLVSEISALGGDISMVPKKAYISVIRKKQFCMIQPSTATRLDLGLILKGTEPTDRLEASGSFNAMFTHRVRLASVEDVDSVLVEWIKEAYEKAG